MFDEGPDPLQVMRHMGHSDIRTTYTLYGHLFPDREDKLVAKLNSRYDRGLRTTGESQVVASQTAGRVRGGGDPGALEGLRALLVA